MLRKPRWPAGGANADPRTRKNCGQPGRSLFPVAVNAFTTNVWLGPSMLAGTIAFSAHRTSCPSCLTPFQQPPLSTSTFPSISTRTMRILHSILSVSLLACHILLPFFPSFAPTIVDLQISNPWMTAEWNGLPFTLLPNAPRLLWVLQWVCRSCGSSTSVRDIL